MIAPTDRLGPNVRGRQLGLTICEDVWNDEGYWRDRRYDRNPVNELIGAGAEVILNLSASPWHLGKERMRRGMLETLAKSIQRPASPAPRRARRI